MRPTLATLSQTVVMAALVTTLCFPVEVLVAILCSSAFDVPFRSLATFGGTINEVAALLLWWVAGFFPAFVYAAFMLQTTADF